jgi:hypothetical protein
MEREGIQITTNKRKNRNGEEINHLKRENPGTGEQITTNKRKNRDGRGDKEWKEREPRDVRANNDKQKEEQGWERR